MDQVQDQEHSKVADWVMAGLYAAIIGANAWLAYDWWKDTPQGAAKMERWRAKVEALRVKAQECEGCAKRKAALRGAMNRMHWQAERIVEGEDVPTAPDAA